VSTAPTGEWYVQTAQTHGRPSGQQAGRRRAEPGLWTAGAHLQFINEQLHYTRLYRFHYWSVSPLNPACLKVDAITYLLTTEEGARERSSLSTSVYYALHVGTHATTRPGATPPPRL
jgi:hypothetical protein